MPDAMQRAIAINATAAAAGAVLLAYILRLRAQLAVARADAAKAVRLRLEERAGRTAAERRLAQKTPDAATTGTRFAPIGRLESCYAERRGTPRQGQLAPAARARLKLDASVVTPAAALEGLAAFSHVWLLYEFHQNTNAAKTPQRMVRAKVHPPGLDGGRCGLFATRTPHRPCPIGLSVARLLEVRGDTLLLGGADVVDGTPVLDVKPYLRHDIQPDARVPAWCERRDDASRLTDVQFAPAAEASLRAALPALDFYAEWDDLAAALRQTLLLDIRSVHQGRGKPADGQAYCLHFDRLRVDFETHDDVVVVTAAARREADGR